MLPSIAKHASLHGIAPLKKFGQNFLFDSSLCDKIVRVSGINQCSSVLEIGSGTGGLSRSILSVNPQKLVSIETDRRCLPLLKEIALVYPNFRVIHTDALKFEIETLNLDKINIVSNLPYNIGTELLIGWLKKIDLIETMTLMLQKEVVDRICSLPNSKSYGRLSVLCQLICSTQKCFEVSAKAFYPPPKVTSSIVKLLPLKDRPEAKIINIIEKITHFAFSQRRKMIKSSLKNIAVDIEEILNHLNINSHLRAENLAPKDYLRIAQALLINLT